MVREMDYNLNQDLHSKMWIRIWNKKKKKCEPPFNGREIF